MSPFLLQKQFLRGLLVALSVILSVSALAQLKPGQQYYRGNRNVIVPKSSVHQKGKIHSDYLINISRGHTALTPHGPFARQTNIPGYHPSQILNVYQIPTGLGQDAIAIVDAQDLPTSLADFNTFSSTFGLPQETSKVATAATNKVFQVVYASGSPPTADPTGWGGEIALDIEWAHAMAPNAKIYLVEADSPFALYTAVGVAINLPGVREVSMSWGSDEYSGEVVNEPTFPDANGITYFASAGDIGGLQSYPAESPNVVGVGGTTLIADANGVLQNETAWIGSGGGPSSFFARPGYQSGVASVVGLTRGCPDVAAVADPLTGVAVFSTGAFGGWAVVGGTSVSCPVTAGITNARINYALGIQGELSRIYANYGSSFYRDIISGTAGGFSAAQGWDFITGIGVPNGLFKTLVPVAIPPTSISIFGGIGTQQSGSLSSLATAGDSDVYSVISGPPTGIGPAAAVEIDMQLPQALSLYSSPAIQMTQSSIGLGTVQLFAYNTGTLKWDVIKAFQGSDGYSNLTYSLTNSFAPYISGTNSIRFVVRAFAPIRYGVGGFNFNIDQFGFTGKVQSN